MIPCRCTGPGTAPSIRENTDTFRPPGTRPCRTACTAPSSRRRRIQTRQRRSRRSRRTRTHRRRWLPLTRQGRLATPREVQQRRPDPSLVPDRGRHVPWPIRTRQYVQRRPRTRPGRCKRRARRRGIRRSRALLNHRAGSTAGRPWRTDKDGAVGAHVIVHAGAHRVHQQVLLRVRLPRGAENAVSEQFPELAVAAAARASHSIPSTLFRTYTRRCPRRIYRYRCTPRRTRPRRTCPRTRTSFPRLGVQKTSVPRYPHG